MSYDALVDRLARDLPETRVATFPDGSVDGYYTAFDEDGEPIGAREAFADRIARGGHESVPVDRESREPGGQAVNMARQTRALGAETVCYGHLDDPVFAELPFETTSMGEPSRISIFAFDDADLLLADSSAAYDDWSLADLAGVSANRDAREALAVDAICCGNWASVDGLTGAVAELAAGPLAAGTFVLDPGAVRPRTAALPDLLEALGDLDARVDVVVSVNRAELAAAVEAIAGAEADRTDRERLEIVRERAGIAAVVLHAADVAAVATRDGATTLEALTVDDPRRRTGAGDRFSAGVAVARSRDWPWETALALGNACAAYAVETASTGDRSELRAFLNRDT